MHLPTPCPYCPLHVSESLMLRGLLLGTACRVLSPLGLLSQERQNR